MTTREQTTERLAKLIENIDIAMLTTVAPGGDLVSRPLSTQGAEFDGERVWFFTEADTPKVAEIRRHPKVNLAYASKDMNTYVSLAGDARINRDRARIDRYWNDALKAFFPKGKDDPNLVLIEVAVRTAEYWDGPGSWLGKAISFVVARVTGNDDVMAENRIVDMRTGRSRKPPSNDTRPRERASKRAPAKQGAGRTRKPAAKTSATGKRTASAAKRTTKKAARPASTAKKTPTRKAPSKKAGAKRAARR